MLRVYMVYDSKVTYSFRYRGGCSHIIFFLIPPWKHMLCVLIRNASVICFLWVPTTYVFMVNKKKWKFLHEKICYGYSLEVPQWANSNEYPQHMFSWRNKKKYQYQYFWLKKCLIWSYGVDLLVSAEGSVTYFRILIYVILINWQW